KKPSPIPLSSGDVKSPDPVKPDVNKPTKPVIELPVKPAIESPYPAVEEAKTIISEKVERKKKRMLQRWEKSSVRTSSCTKEEVDAILIQCGKLSRSNSKTRRYSGSKRSFDFDQNERTRGGGGGEKWKGRRREGRRRLKGIVTRANGSPRERRRRTPSRERERGGAAGWSRRVSRSPAKRSEAINPSGNLVISSNIKFVTVPATDPSSKRVTVKRSIGEACRTAAMIIDQNATKGDKKKKMIKRENEDKRPQVISRSRSLRRSRDFDLSPETLLLQSSEEDKSSYTALLLKDIKDFHGKSSNDDDDEEEEDPFSRLPSCVTKACSIVEAVADLNSTSSDLNRFRFTSTVKKVDLVEPRFEKYVTVKRGCVRWRSKNHVQMGCCLSKKPSPIPLSSGDVKSPDPVKPDLPVKPAIESPYPAVEEAKPIISEKVEKEEENATIGATPKQEDTLAQREASILTRTRGTRGGGGGEVEGEEERRKTTPQRNRDRGGVERANGSPRERRRRTPSRERERGGAAGGSRRVSRSPAKRSEAINPSGNLVISSNIKFVTVPATDPSSKRVTVKRSIGEACRTAAMSNVQPPPRRKPLGVIDQNATKGDKKKKMIKRENEDKRPQVISRSRSLRRSRDFDLKDKSSYTALLLKDIKDFHGKSSNDDDDEEEEDPFSRLPSCVTKACSIVEAVADLNSTSSDLNRFRFTSTVKKVDLVEPRFEKYVTVKRGCCSLEKQESCGSNNLT
ncbi:hypothetical protein HID58_057616, partial [Brassica napus]